MDVIEKNASDESLLESGRQVLKQVTLLEVKSCRIFNRFLDVLFALADNVNVEVVRLDRGGHLVQVLLHVVDPLLGQLLHVQGLLVGEDLMGHGREQNDANELKEK